MQVSKKLKKIIGACIFAGVVIGILKLVSYLFLPQRIGLENAVSAGEKYYLNSLLEPEDTIDVLIFGDSESISFLSTYDLWNNQGIAAYVVGQPGDRIVRSYYKLKELLKTQTPKTVVLETNELYFNADTLNQLNYIRESVTEYYFPIFRYHVLWKQMLHKDNSSPVHFNGFELREGCEPYTGGVYMQDTTAQLPLAKPVEWYLDKFRELCEKNGIRLLLVTSPSPLNHTMERHNALTAYADQYGLSYFDLNMNPEELGIDWSSDTLDGGDHLNYSGSKKVTDFLGNYMKEQCALPDRRTDTRYKDWNARAEQFAHELQ